MPWLMVNVSIGFSSIEELRAPLLGYLACLSSTLPIISLSTCLTDSYTTIARLFEHSPESN